MRVALFVVVVGLTWAKPAPDSASDGQIEITFTRAYLDQVLAALKVYDQYMPDYLVSAVNSLTNEQKDELVKMVNDYHGGKFESLPQNYDDVLKIIETKYPSLAEFTKDVRAHYEADVAKLGPQAQAFAKKWEAIGYQQANPDRVIWACNVFNSGKEFMKEAMAIVNNAEEAAKIGQVFPGTLQFLKSDQFRAYNNALNAMPDKFDCTQDREQIVNTLRLFDIHHLMPPAKKE